MKKKQRMSLVMAWLVGVPFFLLGGTFKPSVRTKFFLGYLERWWFQVCFFYSDNLDMLERN